MAEELRLAERRSLRFAGLRGRTGPFTVAQRNVSRWLGKPATAGIGMIKWNFTLPDKVLVHQVFGALQVLVERNETLRTTYALGEHPVQSVAGEGELPVDVYEGGDDTASTRIESRLRSAPYDPATDWPIRLALLVDGPEVRECVAVYSHLAVDVGGMALLGRQFGRFLADPTVDPVDDAWQPLDRAEWECSAVGRRHLDAAMRYWTGQLRAVPHCVYALPKPDRSLARAWTPPPEMSAAARRSPAVEVKSSAAAMAVPHIAARTGVSPTVVVVAAFVALLAHRAGQRHCAFTAMVGNRMGRHLHGYVGTLAGSSLVTVDADAGTFDELARRTGAASLGAARHAIVDMGALEEIAKQIFIERGLVHTRDVVVNNVHQALGQGVSSEPPPLDGLAAAAELTTTRWTEWERSPQLLNLRMFRLDDTGLTFRLATASAAWVPPTELEALARGVEQVLLAAARGDVDLADLTGLTGVEPGVRGPDWRFVDGCWIDPEQVRSLTADALSPGIVHLEPDGLVAYVAGAPVSSVREAHRRCAEALPGPKGLEYNTYLTIAPRHYVLCASAPDDVSDLAAWRCQPVLDEGSGR